MKLPMPPPSINKELIDKLFQGDENGLSRLFNLMSSDIGKDREDEYLHWDKLRYKKLPIEFKSHEKWWVLVKFRRASSYRKLPLIAINDQKFVYWLPDRLLKLLHNIDKQATGKIESAELIVNSSNSQRYRISSLMEEAITSSQLEGASTTYKVAKNMLRNSRRPHNKSEQMISNNYAAMMFIREAKSTPLTPELILELHKIVTNKTLENKEDEGTFRTRDNVHVFDNRDQQILHTPPPAKELQERINKICDFANSENEHGQFLHPVVRAIILHFMMGFDHPFADGNGRTARALFYWSMAREDYWLIEYLSISKIIKEIPSQYAKAYLYTESDEFDLTYFIDFNLKTILKAIDGLYEYFRRKTNEVKSVENDIHNSSIQQKLNYRQLALISHAIRNQGAIYTFKSHQNSHHISYPTARDDLLELTDLGLTAKVKRGRAFVFRAVNNLEQQLKQLNKNY